MRTWDSLSQAEKDEAIAKARAYIANLGGAPVIWTDIARHCGVRRPEGIRCVLEPSYAEHERERRRKQPSRGLGVAPRRRARLGQAGQGVDPSTVAARLAEIPPDTRSLTARTFGDPLPGRSALAQRGILIERETETAEGVR